jgi:carbon monoxide dehydrogenase subunit G
LRLSQRVEIPLGIKEVWESLNNPEILKQCLSGCEEFTPTEEGGFDIVLLAKVGPVKARFKGEVMMSNVNPPYSYTLSGSGKGGVAGFAKGGADISLETFGDDGQWTRMTYAVKANVGGKLAQLGARLVDGAARKMANDFFKKFIRTICNDPDGKLEIKMETVPVSE